MTRSSTLHHPCRRVGCQPRLESLEARQLLSLPPAFDSVLGVGSDTAYIKEASNAVDAAGNHYVAGTIFGTIDFDPNVVRPGGSDILTPRGTSDPFVAKYAPDNTLIWARRMGSDHVYDASTSAGSSFELGDALALDGAGNVYFTGEFALQADFGSFTLTAVGKRDAFVTKLGPDGTVLWARAMGQPTDDSSAGIAVDPSGNVAWVGRTGNISEIRKFSAGGAEIWTKQISANVGNTAVATDGTGNLYISGTFHGTVDFDPDPRKTSLVTGAADVNNGYVLKLTAAGAFGWVSPFIAKTAVTPGAYTSPNDIAVDGAGNILIGGVYKGQVDFDPSTKIDYRLPNSGAGYGGCDGFVAKLTPAGSLAWATSLTATSVAGGVVESVAVDATGSVYAVGSFRRTDMPDWDAFVAGITSSGAVDWTVSLTGTHAASSIAVDSAGTLYIVGNYIGTADFDPDPTSEHLLTNSAYQDMFLLKLKWH